MDPKMNRITCPKCGRVLALTETDGLWCDNGCYGSEFELWEALQERARQEGTTEPCQ